MKETIPGRIARWMDEKSINWNKVALYMLIGAGVIITILVFR